MALQRTSPWAHIADQLRAEARELAEEDNQLGLLFREAQWDAYEAWDVWDKALSKQGDKAFPVKELAGKMWRVLGETLKSFTMGDLPWQPIGATLGTESINEREAQQTYFCPSLEEVPGLDPTLTIHCRRRGGEATIHFLLYPQENEPPPSGLLIQVTLRRIHPKNGPIESIDVQFDAQALPQKVHLKEVANREQWELTIQRLELAE